MKAFSLHRRIAGILVSGALALPDASAFAQTAYNFNWNLAGDDGISPLQVFDDGQRVYLQFPQGANAPAVFAETPAGPILLTPDTQPPYTVVNGLETKLSFRLQNRTARAWRAAPDPIQAPLIPGNPAPEAVATGQAVPVETGGLAAPIAMNGTAQAPVSAASIAARHGSSPQSGATLASLASSPAAASAAAALPPSSGTPATTPVEHHRITLKQPSASPVVPAVSPSPAVATATGTASPAQPSTAAPAANIATVDITSSSAAGSAPGPSAPAGEPHADPAPTRWEASAGMRLSDLIAQWAAKDGWTVRWDTRLDYPIEAAFSVEADAFLDAANNVFAAYQGAQEPFSVTAYANNVLVVKGLKQ